MSFDPNRPPDCYEELCLWKVFVRTCEAEVWQIVARWVKRYGNPFIVPENETYDQEHDRRMYQEALRFCYVSSKNR